MITEVNIIIPTLGKPHLQTCLDSLQHFPFEHRVILARRGNSWPEAINYALDEIGDGDILLMDDDVEILPGTFDRLEEHYGCGDILGFMLKFPNDTIQHAGGFYSGGLISHIGFKEPAEIMPDYPYLVCHATASLLWIKRHVYDDLGKMVIWPGAQYEDVDFSFRALKRGYKICMVPSLAIHAESATKGDSEEFQQKMTTNYEHVIARHCCEPEFCNELETYPRGLE